MCAQSKAVLLKLHPVLVQYLGNAKYVQMLQIDFLLDQNGKNSCCEYLVERLCRQQRYSFLTFGSLHIFTLITSLQVMYNSQSIKKKHPKPHHTHIPMSLLKMKTKIFTAVDSVLSHPDHGNPQRLKQGFLRVEFVVIFLFLFSKNTEKWLRQICYVTNNMFLVQTKKIKIKYF